MNKTIQISKLDYSKIQKTKEFILGIIKNDFGYDFNPEWHWDIEELKEAYLDNLNSTFFIAEENNNTIATIAARPYDKNYPEFINKYNSKNTLSIWRHYVKKEYRGEGIGTQLLNKVEDFAIQQKYKYIYLHTQKTIPGSLEYWLAKGFNITVDTGDSFKTVHLEKVLPDNI